MTEDDESDFVRDVLDNNRGSASIHDSTNVPLAKGILWHVEGFVESPRELAEEAVLIDEIAVRLTVVRDDLDDSQQQMLGSAATSLHATAALLRTLGIFTKLRRIAKAGGN
jgi:hypothetical protein